MRRLFVVFGIIASFLLPHVARAAVLYPTASDIVVSPGAPARATIEVTNASTVPKEYYVQFQQAVFGDSADDLSFRALSSDVQGNVSATPNIFTLAAQEKKSIEILLRLPVKTYTESPVIAIIVTEKADNPEQGGVQTAVASLLFVHFDAKEGKSTVENFSATPSFTLSGKTTLSALVQGDPASTTLFPNSIHVFGLLGSSRTAFFSDEKHLPPGTSRGASTIWPSDHGFHPLVIGSYRFELWNGDEKVGETKAFFLPPAFLIISGVILLALFLGILKRVRKGT